MFAAWWWTKQSLWKNQQLTRLIRTPNGICRKSQTVVGWTLNHVYPPNIQISLISRDSINLVNVMQLLENSSRSSCQSAHAPIKEFELARLELISNNKSGPGRVYGVLFSRSRTDRTVMEDGVWTQACTWK